jgi:hypothetical protein
VEAHRVSGAWVATQDSLLTLAAIQHIRYISYVTERSTP